MPTKCLLSRILLLSSSRVVNYEKLVLSNLPLPPSMDDWGSDEGGDLSLALDLPDVEIIKPKPAPAPVSAPPAPVVPAVNAWTQRRETSDVRKLYRGPVSTPNSDSRSNVVRQPPRSAPPVGRTPSNHGGAPPGNFGGGGGGGSQTKGVTLYVTNLPSRCEAREIRNIFSRAGCSDVRLTHHSDTGNVRAAFVELAAGVDPENALGLNGFTFEGRSIHVKIDGAGRSGGSGRSRNSYGSSGFGPNGRDGRERNGRGGSGGHWGGSSYEPAGSGGRDRNDRDRTQAMDPTIPTGEAPPGRKKLQLKPRTKPLPVFKVDKSALAEPTTRSKTPKTSSTARGEGAWTRASSNGSGRHFPKSAPPTTNTRKDDNEKVASRLGNLRLNDEKPQVVRKNAFAVLGGDDVVSDS